MPFFNRRKMPSHRFEPHQTIYTLQNTPRKNSEQLAALGKYARPPISRFNHFSIAAAQTGLIFSTRLPKWLGAGCQSWCHIIQHVLHWSQSDARAYFLLSYGSLRDLDSYTNSLILYRLWPHSCCTNFRDAHGDILGLFDWWQIWYILPQQKHLNVYISPNY